MVSKYLLSIEVERLSKISSGYAPLIISPGQETLDSIKHVKFLNFWTRYEILKEFMIQHWRCAF